MVKSCLVFLTHGVLTYQTICSAGRSLLRRRQCVSGRSTEIDDLLQWTVGLQQQQRRRRWLLTIKAEIAALVSKYNL